MPSAEPYRTAIEAVADAYRALGAALDAAAVLAPTAGDAELLRDAADRAHDRADGFEAMADG